MKKLYKVLKVNRETGEITSPYQNFIYELGVWYFCEDFDTDSRNRCSKGFYATGIEGVTYAYRDFPEYGIFEVHVRGRSVKTGIYKNRYEEQKIVRELSKSEVIDLASNCACSYNLVEAIYPTNPLRGKPTVVTNKHKDLLKEWSSVFDSVGDSVFYSVRASVWDSVWAYISSIFYNIKDCKCIKHKPGENPFQPCIDLWNQGIVPVFDGKYWYLCSGEKAEIIYKVSKEDL